MKLCAKRARDEEKKKGAGRKRGKKKFTIFALNFAFIESWLEQRK